MQLKNQINQTDLMNKFNSFPHNPKLAQINEIIWDWAISSESNQSYGSALSYIYDELINDPEDYDFNFRDLSLYILRIFY